MRSICWPGNMKEPEKVTAPRRCKMSSARKARGCDLAFDLFVEVPLAGELPGGGRDSVTIRVASIVPFFIMKGMALEDRLKEKDAWDIYYCVLNYPGGLDAFSRSL